MKKIFTLVAAMLAGLITLNAAEINIDDATMAAAGNDVTWTSDNVYILDGLVFVNDGQTLTIEAGTVIKGMPGQDANASALIVARGATIHANGTSTDPIIFTSQNDNLDGTLPLLTSGQWGGVIVLGKGITNETTTDNAVEGIPTSEPRGLYGGDVFDDNSGSMTYVSIRHGGTDIGEGNEINGLTLGAVGSATTFSYIEIVANKDDGVEWFGGAPKCDHILVAWVGDDSFDYDQGYSGMNQFMVAIQTAESAGDIGDRCGEHDGGDSNELGTPFAHPIFSNVTYVGASSGRRVIAFRDNAGGGYHNSIFASQDKGIDIEWRDDEAATPDPTGLCSYSQWKDEGILHIANNIFQDVADGTGAGILTVVSEQGKNPDGSKYDKYSVPQSALDDFAAYFTTAGNSVASVGVDAANPTAAGDISGADFTSMDSWFTQVTYKGAFDLNENWASGWTLSLGDVVAKTPTTVDSDMVQIFKMKVYPNPVVEFATIEFENSEGVNHSFHLFDMAGREVTVIRNIHNSTFQFEREGLYDGVYIYRLISETGAVASGKMLLK